MGKSRVLGLAAILVLAVSASAWAAAGDLDTTFSGDGKVTTNIGPDLSFDVANAVAVQDDGKIVVAGSSNPLFEDDDFLVARYRKGGALDDTFSQDGIKLTDFDGSDDIAYDLAIQPDGRIVVVGFMTTPTGDFRFAIARYRPNGGLDQQFSGDGKAFVTFPGGTGLDQARAVALEEDGEIVVVGESDRGAGMREFAITRLTPGGARDLDFSEDGRFVAGFQNSNSGSANDVAIQGNGRIVVAGTANDTTEKFVHSDLALLRLRPNGLIDLNFANEGYRRTDVAGFNDMANAVALDPTTGRIVVAGRAEAVLNDQDFLVARYLPGGARDSDFGDEGLAVENIESSGEWDEAHDLLVLANSKVVIAGQTQLEASSDIDFVVLRLASNGFVDDTFSISPPAGAEVTDFDGAGDIAYGLARQAPGKLILAGEANTGNKATGSDVGLARYFAN